MDRLFAYFILAGLSLSSMVSEGAGNTGQNRATPSKQSAALNCYHDAVETLDGASRAKANSDASGSIAAVGSAGTQLDAAGKATSGMGSAQTAQASSAASACEAEAIRAQSQAAACPAVAMKEKNPSQAQYLQGLLNSEFNPRAESIITKCGQNAAGYAGTSASLGDASSSMMMMTAMSGLGALGGTGPTNTPPPDGLNPFINPDINNPYYPYNNPDDRGPADRKPPVVTNPQNDRTPIAKDDPADAGDGAATKPINLGTADVIKLNDGSGETENENAGGSRGLAGQYGGGKSPVAENSIDGKAHAAGLSGSGATASASGVAAADVAGAGPAFEPFDFGSSKGGSAVAQDQEALDAAYLGKNKKQKQSLAAQLAQQKQEAAEAKDRQRELAMANAKKLASDFKATAKSCAERKWEGKECKALKADPLLNVD